LIVVDGLRFVNLPDGARRVGPPIFRWLRRRRCGYHHAMKCPACKTLMFVMEYDRLELDQCPACEGVWFDATELSLLFGGRDDLTDDAVARLPDADTVEERRRCPHCRRHLRKVVVGDDDGVLIDACPAGHGVFFDRGEVGALSRRFEDAAEDLPARLLSFLGEAYSFDPEDNETEKS